MAERICDIIEIGDLDVDNKLENMLFSEISLDVYGKCLSRISEIEDRIWDILWKDEKFSNAEYFSGYAPGYRGTSYRDRKQAEVYNCDLLYMIGIADVLGLKRPVSSEDIDIFGL